MTSLYSAKVGSVQPASCLARVGLVLTALLLCSQLSVAAAEQGASSTRDTLYFTSPPGADQIGQHLFPQSSLVKRTRGITISQPTEPALAQKSVGMPILFHFGKTTIVEQSRAFLDNVGEMMISAQYADRTLIVEGHTDAVGSAQYNQRLSELRALAIKEYLVQQFGIDPLRLFPSGRGESMLYEPRQPNDGVNRRVEFLPYQQG